MRLTHSLLIALLAAPLALAAQDTPVALTGVPTDRSSSVGWLTIYNQDFAVARTSIDLDLHPGLNEVTTTHVTSRLEPDSVVLRDPAGKRAVHVLEQNYDAAIVNQDWLLQKYEGKTIDFQVSTPQGSPRSSRKNHPRRLPSRPTSTLRRVNLPAAARPAPHRSQRQDAVPAPRHSALPRHNRRPSPQAHSPLANQLRQSRPLLCRTRLHHRRPRLECNLQRRRHSADSTDATGNEKADLRRLGHHPQQHRHRVPSGPHQAHGWRRRQAPA